MKYILILSNILIVIIVLNVFGNKKIDSNLETFSHIVEKGETISLLCIDYFGFFSKELADSIKKRNPIIKDINLIYPGQTVILVNPLYKKKTQDSSFVNQHQYIVQAVVTYVEGDAYIFSNNQKEAKKLFSNTIIYPGDVIQTKEGARVEIIINKEAVIRLKEKTRLTLSSLKDTSKAALKTKADFNIGAIWAKIKKIRDSKSSFDVELPNAVAGVHGTVYEAEIQQDSSSEIKVFSGEVVVKNSPAMVKKPNFREVGEISGPLEIEGPKEVSLEEWSAILKEMQKIKIDKKGKAGKIESFSKNEKDLWENWNIERDKRISKLFKENEK